MLGKTNSFLRINFLSLILVMCFCASSFAQELVETGFLRNRVGLPLTRIVQMQFRVYDQPTGGTLYWDSGTFPVSVNEGLYTAHLGRSPQPPITEFTFPTSSNYYMRYTFDTEDFPSRDLIAHQARAILSDRSINSLLAQRAITADFANSVAWANVSEIRLSGNLYVTGDFQLSGKVIYSPASVFLVTNANLPITYTTTLVRVRGSAAPMDMTATQQIATGNEGEQLIVMGTSDTNWVKLNNGNGLVLFGGASFTLGNNDIIRFVYSGGAWLELSRSDN